MASITHMNLTLTKTNIKGNFFSIKKVDPQRLSREEQDQKKEVYCLESFNNAKMKI